MKDFPALFSPCRIGRKTALNRFVAQPMEGNDSRKGGVSDLEIGKYIRLAKGGWGVIIIEAMSVSSAALARENQLILNNETLNSFKQLVAKMKKEAPDTIILFQITHSGRKGNRAFSQATALYNAEEGEHLLATEEIEDIKNSFIQTALLAEKAGADGIDLKMCHGYFGCEILRPANIRSDRWGGSFENRTRLLRESITTIREKLIDKTFILGSRISYYEGIRGGCGTLAEDEIIENLRVMDSLILLMESLNMDYVNISAGIPGVTSEITRPTPSSKLFYLHQFRYAKRARAFAGTMKVIGSAYSILKEDGLDLAEENILDQNTDFVGYGRQILADPLFPKKVRLGEKVDYCTACSGCSKLLIRQKFVGCTVTNKYYRDLYKEK